MSRVGNAPITVPNGVDIKISGMDVTVKGPAGQMALRLPDPRITLDQDGATLMVRRGSADKRVRAFHGLVNRLVGNMIIGVTTGFRKELELRGVGYRAAMDGRNCVLQLGYSHPITVEPPEGITIAVEKNQTLITVSGMDKQAVGQVAANIRRLRPPEPYKGKGVRYVGEYVRMLEGKKASKG